MKTCSKCKIEKPTEEFIPLRVGRKRVWCKLCWNSYMREYMKKNGRKYYAEYGLTVSQFEELRIKQDNRCGICREVFIKTPHVDHNHETGQRRGLLCSDCNQALGQLKEDTQVMLNMIEYIREYSTAGSASI